MNVGSKMAPKMNQKINKMSILEAIQKCVPFFGALGATLNQFFNDFICMSAPKWHPKWTPKSIKNRSWSLLVSRKGPQMLQVPSGIPFWMVFRPIFHRFLVNLGRLLACFTFTFSAWITIGNIINDRASLSSHDAIFWIFGDRYNTKGSIAQ